MEPYPPAAASGCDTPAALTHGELSQARDTFARSRAVLEEMAARLSSAELLAGTHDQVEDYLTAAGRELQRQLLQDHLDVRAAVEERQAEVIGTDGIVRRRAESGRRRQLATTVGRVEVTRIAYRVGDELLVMSADATGVSMIPADLREPVRAAGATRTRTPQPPSAQLSARDKPGRRRMATVDAHPAPRTAADILPSTAVERAERAPGPATSGRVVAASLARTPAQMIHDLFEQAHARDPQHRRRWIALVDGNNHQIDRIRHEAATRGVQVTTAGGWHQHVATTRTIDTWTGLLHWSAHLAGQRMSQLRG